MQYYGTRLSENISRREPEGYLLCLNVPVARTGSQDYLPDELGLPPEGGLEGDRKALQLISVQRPEEEVFAPETIASFEGMPVTNDHPPDGVTVDNIRMLQKGHAHNVRRGAGDESDLLLADLIITDPVLIDEILAGKREISCGYTYELHEENGQYIQRKIRGNHVAVVDAGRAGSRVSIKDEHPSGSMIRVTDSASSIVATPHRGARSFQMSSSLTRFPPLAVVTDSPMLQPPALQRGMRRSHRKPKDHQPERSYPTMKKSLFKKLTKMARDGDPEAIEALAEAVEEIIETPSAEPDAPEVAVVAAAVAPDPAPAAAEPAPVEVEAETAAVTVDSDTLNAILERLDQLIALLTPAAADEDPAEPATEDLPEELAEVVEEALEAVEETSGEPALEEAAEQVAAVVEEVLTEETSTVLEPEDPDSDDCNPDDPACTGDALRTALRAVRPALKKMSPKDRRKVTADIAARLSRKDAAHNRRYAALNDAKTSRASSYTDLGKQIMQKRNPNYRG